MLERRVFGDRGELATALAEAVAANLVAGIAERGRGSLAVSGGTTPHPYRAGEWGPRAAEEMLDAEGRRWRRP